MIQRKLSAPLSILAAPFEFFGEIWNDAGRGAFLLMGLPAVVVAVLGVSLVLWAEIGNLPRLEKRYDSMAQECNEQSKKLYAELTRELQVIQNVSPSTQANDIKTGIPDSDPRKQELLDWQEKERIYLEKLISLNKDNPDYIYRLALLSLQQGDQAKCYSLMLTAAPVEEPRYAKAHLFMANMLLRQPVTTPAEATRNRTLALAHVDNCLVREKDNVEALQLRAMLLADSQQWTQAYEIYEKLFQDDPLYYVPLIKINVALRRPEKNDFILDNAIIKFRQRTIDESDNVDLWVQSWQHLVNCLIARRNFNEAESSLKAEIEKQKTEAAKKKFLESQLAFVYTNWAEASGGRDANADQQVKQLEYLKSAMQYNPTNAETLRLLTLLGNSPYVGTEAKKIYDGTNDVNAPAEVLSEIGGIALAKGDYENAITYFELARKKSPKNPLVLNNLAYSYLVCENRNPERALLLIDQAVTYIATMGSQKNQYMSYFLDTRGTALMQLDRLDEAASAFEISIQQRPDNKEILQKLIQCYEGRDEKLADTYRRRLQKLEQQDLNSNASDNSTNSK